MTVPKTPIENFKEIRKTIQTSRQLLKMVWHLSPGIFLGNLLTNIVPAVLPFVNAYIYKLIIDLVILGVSTNSFNYPQFYTLLGFRVVTYLIQNFTYTAQTYFDLLLWTKLPAHLYQTVLGKVASLDMQHFEDPKFRDKLEKVVDTYQWRPLNMLSNLFGFFQFALLFLIALIAIIQLNWLLIPVVLLALIPSFVVQNKYAKVQWGIWNENSPYRKKFNYVSSIIQGLQSVKELKVFQMSEFFLKDIKEIYVKFVRDNLKVATQQARTNSAVNLLDAAVYMGIEVFVFFSAIAKRITIGDISYYTSVLGSFKSGMDGVFRNVSNLYGQALYVSEMFDLLQVKSSLPVVSNPVKLKLSSPPKIEFKNVSFAYPGTNNKILNSFNLTINPGEKIAFVGENGAGKTTIIKLLARFYDVDEGRILINDIDIAQLDLNDWYESLGVLFQDFIRYEYSLKQNIGFGRIRRQSSIDEIINAARLSGADRVAKQLENQYDQVLGKTFEGGVDLSTGQWQKVALGRAFLRDAPLLILDEPTASIDAKAESEIFNRVERLSRGKTVIIISHRFSTVRNADKIYVLEGGKIIESGSHKELLKQNGVYSSLFTLQAKGYK